jgi:hypothetical protein
MIQAFTVFYDGQNMSGILMILTVYGTEQGV